MVSPHRAAGRGGGNAGKTDLAGPRSDCFLCPGNTRDWRQLTRITPVPTYLFQRLCGPDDRHPGRTGER
ncbi:hypothetical protein MJ579_09260 [Klebsiella pneumoniae]|nr:hypothetical protein MJ579_09260 [Klebsiella pneumoniae]